MHVEEEQFRVIDAFDAEFRHAEAKKAEYEEHLAKAEELSHRADTRTHEAVDNPEDSVRLMELARVCRELSDDHLEKAEKCRQELDGLRYKSLGVSSEIERQVKPARRIINFLDAEQFAVTRLDGTQVYPVAYFDDRNFV